MKRFLVLILLSCAVARAGDITPTFSFSDGVTYHASDFNNAISTQVIQPSFVSGKSNAVPVAADEFLFYQVGSTSLKQATLTQLQAGLANNNIGVDFYLSGVISPAQVTSTQNDYSPTGLATASTLRVNTDATRNFTGLSGGAAGRIIIWINVGSFTEQLNNENTGSAAANRFDFENGLDDYILPGGSRVLVYDAISSRWRCASRYYNPNPPYLALTDGATITWTCDPTKVSQNASVTIAGNRTLAMSGANNGMQGILFVKQDGTGSRTLTLPPGSKVAGGGSGAVTLSTAANTVDALSWTYDGTSFFWLLNKNFN
jgi:hypothetical protein